MNARILRSELVLAVLLAACGSPEPPVPIPVEVPPAPAPPERREHRLILAADGQATLDGEPIEADALDGVLDDAAEVVIEADPVVEHARVVAWIDALRGVGVARFALETGPVSDERPAPPSPAVPDLVPTTSATPKAKQLDPREDLGGCPRGEPHCWTSPPDPCSDGLCVDGVEIDVRPPRPRGRPYGEVLPTLAGTETPSATGWIADARAEHASVAAFASHVLELLAIGAPSELVAGATRAQADELRHAALCLEVARSLGADVVLGPLPRLRTPATDLCTVLVRVAAEGCVAESLSVWSMIAQLERTTDARQRRVLTTLIADETRHAALAWRTLAWGLPRLTVPEQRAVWDALRCPEDVDRAAWWALVARPAAALFAQIDMPPSTSMQRPVK